MKLCAADQWNPLWDFDAIDTLYEIVNAVDDKIDRSLEGVLIPSAMVLKMFLTASQAPFQFPVKTFFKKSMIPLKTLIHVLILLEIMSEM